MSPLHPGSLPKGCCHPSDSFLISLLQKTAQLTSASGETPLELELDSSVLYRFSRQCWANLLVNTNKSPWASMSSWIDGMVDVAIKIHVQASSYQH